jgi:hypothetical protein
MARPSDGLPRCERGFQRRLLWLDVARLVFNRQYREAEAVLLPGSGPFF